MFDTKKEKSEKQIEHEAWLAALKENDEVCFTNDTIANMLFGMAGMFNSMYGNLTENKEPMAVFCKISKVRGRLSDGSIIIEGCNTVFDKEGKLPSDIASLRGELIQPTQELRQKAEKFIFADALRQIDWNKVDYDVVEEMAKPLNKFLAKLAKEKEASAAE